MSDKNITIGIDMSSYRSSGTLHCDSDDIIIDELVEQPELGEALEKLKRVSLDSQIIKALSMDPREAHFLAKQEEERIKKIIYYSAIFGIPPEEFEETISPAMIRQLDMLHNMAESLRPVMENAIKTFKQFGEAAAKATRIILNDFSRAWWNMLDVVPDYKAHRKRTYMYYRRYEQRGERIRKLKARGMYKQHRKGGRHGKH